MYKIGEAAKMLKVGVHTLRFWEEKFPHIKHERKGRIRYYDNAAMHEFEKIKRMMRDYHMDVKGIQKMIQNDKIVNNVRKVRGKTTNMDDKTNIDTSALLQQINEIKQDISDLINSL